MSGKLSEMVDEMTLAGVISGQFEFPQQNLRSSFSFLLLVQTFLRNYQIIQCKLPNQSPNY